MEILNQFRGSDARVKFASVVQNWEVSDDPGYDLDTACDQFAELGRPDGMTFAEYRAGMGSYIGSPVNVLRGGLTRPTVKRDVFSHLPRLGDVCRALVVPPEVDYVTILSSGKPVFTKDANNGRVAFDSREIIPLHALNCEVTVKMYTMGARLVEKNYQAEYVCLRNEVRDAMLKMDLGVYWDKQRR